ncbi:Hypothetical_protein [Hexamita inflata]|uniref:Hypothetical_protein n=1 Tax=Hexamita inflata TaxID=28002 RepID=A0AA86P6F1_9EUKA|nr:Hypothetical protein HINF_LOCUS20203 [Hexamita inflata]
MSTHSIDYLYAVSFVVSVQNCKECTLYQNSYHRSLILQLPIFQFWSGTQKLIPKNSILYIDKYIHICGKLQSAQNGCIHIYIYYLLKHNGLRAVAKKALGYLLTDNLNNCQDVRKRTQLNDLQVDAMINVFQVLAGNSSFKYNVELLQLAREVIIVYKQEVGPIAEELQVGSSATFLNQSVSKQQLKQLNSLMNSINCDDLFLKLKAVIIDMMWV